VTVASLSIALTLIINRFNAPRRKRSLAACVSFRPSTNSLANADISLPSLLSHPNPIVRSRVWYNTHARAHMHAPTRGRLARLLTPSFRVAYLCALLMQPRAYQRSRRGTGRIVEGGRGASRTLSARYFLGFWLMVSRARGAGSRCATCTRGPLATPKACKNLPLDPHAHAYTSFA